MNYRFRLPSVDQTFGLVILLAFGLAAVWLISKLSVDIKIWPQVKILGQVLLLLLVIIFSLFQFFILTAKFKSNEDRFKHFTAAILEHYQKTQSIKRSQGQLLFQVPVEGLAFGFCEVSLRYRDGFSILTVSTFNRAGLITPFYFFHDRKILEQIKHRLEKPEYDKIRNLGNGAD